MTIEQMNNIIKRINLMNVLGLSTTRHAIAKNTSSTSRSTVYRRINRMVDMGLLFRGERDTSANVYISDRGIELNEACRELPL